MEAIPLLLHLIYPVFVVGFCSYLLIRGLTHSFLLCFIGGAILHAVPTIGIALLQQAPGGFGANVRWMPAFSAVGIAGSVIFAVGFILLGRHLLRNDAQPAASGGANYRSARRVVS